MLLADARQYCANRGTDYPRGPTRDEVVHRFESLRKPSPSAAREVLAYQKDKLIKGTTQAQFKIAPKSGVVERIDVFPRPVLSLADISQAYGPECTPESPESRDHTCYLKRSDEKRNYVVYQALGLAVFFTPDGKQVQSFAFLPEKK